MEAYGLWGNLIPRVGSVTAECLSDGYSGGHATIPEGIQTGAAMGTEQDQIGANFSAVLAIIGAGSPRADFSCTWRPFFLKRLRVFEMI